jgi:hypothetical protein
MSRSLVLVKQSQETPALRASELQALAKTAAAEHIADTLKLIDNTILMAAEIADGGDAYPHGVREEMRRLTAHLRCVSDRTTQIMERQW